jgi:hypothetical protein
MGGLRAKRAYNLEGQTMNNPSNYVHPTKRQTYHVLIETNATNGGDPAKRAMHANGEDHAADLVLWLHLNGIAAKVVTGDRYNEKLRNYNDRVSAAS